MGVCDFRLQASSALLPGGLLEGLLAPMLEKSTRRAVVWQGTPRPKSGSGRALNWKNQARKTTTGMRKRGVGSLVSAIVLSSSTLAIAQDYRGTAERRASCMPDAFRLCASYIPDATKVEMCLRQQKPALSEACRSVFEQKDGSVTSGIRNETWSTD